MSQIDLLPDLENQFPPYWPVKRCQDGDIWRLDEHYLMCGDSTNGELFWLLFHYIVDHNKMRPDLILTDPPYGTNTKASSLLREEANRLRKHATQDSRNKYDILNGYVNSANNRIYAAHSDNYYDLPQLLKALFIPNGDVIFTWFPFGIGAEEFYKAFRENDFKIKTMITWVKNHIILQRFGYHLQTEHALLAQKRGTKLVFYGGRTESNVWDIQTINSSKGNSSKQRDDKTQHANQKPLECMIRPLKLHSKQGDIIYDPFAGSGTTIMACQTLKRICLAMEIVPDYCDMILSRFEYVFKIKPELVFRKD